MVDIIRESFETDGNGTRYTLSIDFNDGTSDHFGVTDQSDISNVSGAYTGLAGSFLVAGEDLDDDGGNLNDVQTFDLNQVDISGFTNIEVSGLFGAGNENGPGNSNYDLADYLAVLYSTDGGATYMPGLIFNYVNGGDDFNEPLAQVTTITYQAGVTAQQAAAELGDFDGNGTANYASVMASNGDATELLGTALQSFSFTVPDATTLDIRIAAYFDAGSEEFAFDDIAVTGDVAAPPFAIAQSFEDETPGSQYVDTGNAAVDHDLVNNAGESPVDSTSATTTAGTLGFDATYVNTRNDVGLTDGDFVGVTNFTGDVGAFTDGTQGYQLQDADGLMRVTFDTIDLSALGDVAFSMDYFLNETGWEADDLVRIYLDTNAADVTIFDSTGQDIDDLAVEGSWQQGTATLDASLTSVALVVELDSNSGSESLYIDNISFAETGPAPATSLAIAATDAVKAEGDAGTTAFTFTVTRSGDTSGATDVDYAVTSADADAADFGGSLPSGTVSFLAGETTRTITIDVSGDTDAELDEDFTVTLSNATGGATISTAAADGTIQNDDGVLITMIHDIQGNSSNQVSNPFSGNDNTDGSPLDGQIVTVEAIVVGDFQNGDADATRNLGGFYLQEEDGDADADMTTSEGIFVFDDSFGVDVNVGDLVQVTGTVDEFFGETQIDTITNVSVISSGNTLPTAAVVDLGTTAGLGLMSAQDGSPTADLEAYEGMLVTFSDTLSITEMFQLDRFNEIRLSADGRLEQFTQSNAPSVAGYAQHIEDNAVRSIIYDDGLNLQNQSIDNLDGFGPYSTATSPRMGDTIDSLTGVLSFSWAGNSASQGDWRVRSHIDGTNTVTEVNSRPETSPQPTGELTVATLNVLNFFTTLDEFPSVGEGSGPNGLEPRGADASPQNALPGFGPTDEYDRQLAKLVEALVEMDGDVVGLVELENDFLTGGASPTGTGTVIGSGVAIDELVDAVNAVVGAGTYDYVRPPAGGEFVGDDAIAVGYIYNTSTVNLSGDSIVIDDAGFVDPNGTGTGRNRAALVQTFEEAATGEDFTLIINHFKSKGDSGLDANNDGIPDDPSNVDSDQFDGQGYWNDTRTDAANYLANWVATNLPSDQEVMILGDLNAYASEDPITALETAGFTDLADTFIPGAYSFVFDGQTGTLDYALANAQALSVVEGAVEWHINADEADAIDYNLEFDRDPAIFDGTTPARNSDHDPILVGLTLQADIDLYSDFSATTRTGRFGDFATALTAATANAYVRVEDSPAVGDVGAQTVTVENLTVYGQVQFGADFTLGGSVAEFTLAGGAAASITGNSVDNLLRGNLGGNAIDGADGDDVTAGRGGNDTLLGNAGSDRLLGGGGDDNLDAGTENDMLVGGDGADTLNGGDGFDGANYRRSTAGVTVDLETNTASGGDAQGDSLVSIERIFGSDFADVLTGNAENNDLRGFDGNDTIDGGAGRDVIRGGEGDDVLTGGAGRDSFVFEATVGFSADRVTDFVDGQDRFVMRGITQAETVLGDDGNGNATVLYNTGSILITGGAGVVDLTDFLFV